MEVLKKGNVSSISPPEPEADNPFTLSEALNAINAVLLNYRGFDKIKAILTAAQDVEDNKAARQQELDDLAAQIEQSKADLAAAQKQVLAAQGDKAKVLSDIEQAKKRANKFLADKQAAFDAKLEKQQQEFTAELQEQARVAQVALEDTVAGLKRERGGLQKAVDALKAEIDTLTPVVEEKRAAAAQAMRQLEETNAALNAIKSRL